MWQCSECGKTGEPHTHTCEVDLERLVARYRDMAGEAQMKADSCNELADQYQRQLDEVRSS